MKKLAPLLLSLITIFSLSVPAFASNNVSSLYVNESDVEIVPDNELTGTTSPQSSTPDFVNDFRYRKVGVKISHGWSPYKRVSDNIITNSKGGSITATKSVTFGIVVSGNIYGLNISTSAKVCSKRDYTLNVGANKHVYLGYHVHYKIEKGTRELYDIVTGKVVSKNEYTVKTPQYGEYKLINY